MRSEGLNYGLHMGSHNIFVKVKNKNILYYFTCNAIVIQKTYKVGNNPIYMGEHMSKGETHSENWCSLQSATCAKYII